jgi:hypothetical protein
VYKLLLKLFGWQVGKRLVLVPKQVPGKILRCALQSRLS